MNDINVCCLRFFVAEALEEVRPSPQRGCSLIFNETLETGRQRVSAAFTTASINNYLKYSMSGPIVSMDF
jgi:hypothetical protein